MPVRIESAHSAVRNQVLAVICAHSYNAIVIWRKTTLLFCHIHQVAARVTKLVVAGEFGTAILGEGEIVGVSAMVT